jgi:hypothetical protein
VDALRHATDLHRLETNTNDHHACREVIGKLLERAAALITLGITQPVKQGPDNQP